MSKTNSGHIYEDKRAGAWFVRFYTGKVAVQPDGKKKYEAKAIRLGSTSAKDEDYIRTKAQARELARKKVPAAIARASRTDSTVKEYYEAEVLPLWQRKLADGNMKPSTVDGYRKIFQYYVEESIGGQKLVDFTTGGASRFLDGLALARLNSTTISHIRSVASLIFDHAAAKDVIPVNPFRGAKMLESAKRPEKMRFYTVEEIARILTLLRGHLPAQVAVGLCYFCGLRPGEARAVRWENYDGSNLKIDASQWRKELGTPKTKESIQAVPVMFPLNKLLDELRAAEGNPSEGFILHGERSNGAMNLDHLAEKIIKPALKGVGIKWAGYYACRRGCATAVTEGSSPQAAAGLLRHKGIGTTIEHYIGLEAQHKQQAAESLSARFLETQKLLQAGD